ncbi:MAG: glycosyltransferase [Acidobacteriota bacterium]|nr:glycosyltransferase [Acidobacteriota bacterium]
MRLRGELVAHSAATTRRTPPAKTSDDANSVSTNVVHFQSQSWSEHNGAGAPRPRVALYSHDTMGLGHMRRNLLLAQTLAAPPVRAVVLMIAGARQAGTFALPDGADCMILPALHKGTDGKYSARRLDVSLQDLIALRSKTIRAALEEFEPDVLIVDNVPRGAVGELNASLENLRARGTTRCVLGLRDVLDDPAVVEREWRRAANEDAIRDFYDAVWVYGDPAVYDLRREYRLSPDVTRKVRYTGYLDQRLRLELAKAEGVEPHAEFDLPSEPFVLCMLGGGQDGALLAEAFAAAELPPGNIGVILTGPFMSRAAQQRLRRLASPRLRVLEFVSEPTLLLQRAERVIAMGGYNTTCEMLSFEKRALLVPRVRPRQEQMIRAERLRDLNLLDVLHPDELCPRALSAWLAADPQPLPPVRDLIMLDGLTRLPQLLDELLAAPPVLQTLSSQRSLRANAHS